MININGCAVLKFKFHIPKYDKDQIYIAKVSHMVKHTIPIPKKEDDYIVIIFWQKSNDFDVASYSISFAQQCIDDGTWVIIE